MHTCSFQRFSALTFHPAKWRHQSLLRRRRLVAQSRDTVDLLAQKNFARVEPSARLQLLVFWLCFQSASKRYYGHLSSPRSQLTGWSPVCVLVAKCLFKKNWKKEEKKLVLTLLIVSDVIIRRTISHLGSLEGRVDIISSINYKSGNKEKIKCKNHFAPPQLLLTACSFMSIFILRPRSEIFRAASWVFLRKNLRALWGIFRQGCWERRSCHTNDDKWRGDGLLFFSSSSIVFVAANCTPQPNGNNVFNGSICIALWERKKHETTRWQRNCCSASHSSALQVLVAVLSGSVPHCSL